MKKTDKDQAFDTELGQKAIVQHYIVPPSERNDQLREVLADIGKDIQMQDQTLKVLEYKGSFSVHVYAGNLNNFAFMGLNNIGGCPFKLAEAAGMKLNQDIREHFYGARQKKRSGF